ncbi:hypothetical protein MS6207_01091 [Escherichia coli]|nr:hypothetical protein [Escherichia coli]
MDTQELNHMIAEAYSRDLQKPELVSFKEVSRWGVSTVSPSYALWPMKVKKSRFTGLPVCSFK